MVSYGSLLKWGILAGAIIYGSKYVFQEGGKLGSQLGTGLGSFFSQAIGGASTGIVTGLEKGFAPFKTLGQTRGEEALETKQDILTRMVEAGATEKQIDQVSTLYDQYAAVGGWVPGLSPLFESFLKSSVPTTATIQSYQGAGPIEARIQRTEATREIPREEDEEDLANPSVPINQVRILGRSKISKTLQMRYYGRIIFPDAPD